LTGKGGMPNFVTGDKSRVGLTRSTALHDGFTVNDVRHELAVEASYSRVEIHQLVPANLKSAFVTGRDGRTDLLVCNAGVSGGVGVPRLRRPTSRQTSEGAT
jgi:hypothetical protein